MTNELLLQILTYITVVILGVVDIVIRLTKK